jgi:protein-tyrosine sulfotransferase
MLENCFFVTGCQRSGTTLLRLILGSHSRIKCFDELISEHFLPNLHNGVTPPELAKFKNVRIGFKVPRFAEQFLNSEMADPDYGRFPTCYKAQEIVFILRNPLDVIASMATLQVQGESWLLRHGRRTLLWNSQNADFSSAYKEELAKIKQYPDRWELVGALYWCYKNEALLEYVANRLPIYPILYEDLVASPTWVLEPLVDRLGLRWESALLAHHEQAHGETSTDGFTIGRTQSRLPISDSSIGKYREVLNQKQIANIRSMTGDLEAKLEGVVSNLRRPSWKTWSGRTE